MPDRAYVDMEAALGRVRGNKTIYRKMLDLFLNSTEFDTLDRALESKDIEQAAQAAHGIKGMTGNLGLTKLFDTSAELMNQLRQGEYNEETVGAYRDALAETRLQVADVIKELDSA